MVVHGLGINWGVNSTVAGVNGMFQSREHNYRVESEEIKDGGETTVSKVYWDFREEATFTYVAIQFSTGIINANVDIPYLGEFVNISDPRYPAIAGYWLVDEITTEGSNTSATRVTLKLTRYPYVSR